MRTLGTGADATRDGLQAAAAKGRRPGRPQLEGMKGAIHISLVSESGWPHPIPWYRRVGGPIQSLVPESGWPHPIPNLPLLS
jgi:hypothetical protein